MNQQLFDMAMEAIRNCEKRAFVAGSDPVMTGQSQMDPAMADPAAGAMPPGGPMPPTPPGDPAAAAGPDMMGMLTQAVTTALQQAGIAGGASGAGGGGEAIKPKIDVNVEIMQMKKILARIADALQIPIPAAEMVATSGDLMQMAQQQQQQQPPPPASAPPPGGEPSLQPMQPMSPAKTAGAHAFAEDDTDSQYMRVIQNSDRNLGKLSALGKIARARNNGR